MREWETEWEDERMRELKAEKLKQWENKGIINARKRNWENERMRK